MTEQEAQSIKILARIMVEGIVNTVQKQRDEREAERESRNLDRPLHHSDSAVGADNLVSTLKVIS